MKPVQSQKYTADSSDCQDNRKCHYNRKHYRCW